MQRACQVNFYRDDVSGQSRCITQNNEIYAPPFAPPRIVCYTSNTPTGYIC